MGRPKNKYPTPKIITYHDAPYIAWTHERKIYRVPLKGIKEEQFKECLAEAVLAIGSGKWPKWAAGTKSVDRWLRLNIKEEIDIHDASNDRELIAAWEREFRASSSEGQTENRIMHLKRLRKAVGNLLEVTKGMAADFMVALRSEGGGKYFSHDVAQMIGQRTLTREEIIKEAESKKLNPHTSGHSLKKAISIALRSRGVFAYEAKERKYRVQEEFALGIAARTWNNHLHTYKMFYRWLEKKYLISQNPFAGIKQVKVPHDTSIIYLTREERDIVIKAVKGQKFETPVWIAIYAGLRRGELARLQKTDIDLEKRWITVAAGKTDKKREVPVSNALKEHLQGKTLSRRVVSHWPAGSYGNTADTDIEKIIELVPQYLEPKIRWNIFRHTFASLLAQTGQLSIDQIAALMGNSPEVCKRHYAKLLPEAAEKTGIDLID